MPVEICMQGISFPGTLLAYTEVVISLWYNAFHENGNRRIVWKEEM